MVLRISKKFIAGLGCDGGAVIGMPAPGKGGFKKTGKGKGKWKGKHNWKGKNVLLIGSEGFGIKAKTLDNSDFRFKVNMNNKIESLNIANTVSVVCHHIFHSINKESN